MHIIKTSVNLTLAVACAAPIIVFLFIYVEGLIVTTIIFVTLTIIINFQLLNIQAEIIITIWKWIFLKVAT